MLLVLGLLIVVVAVFGGYLILGGDVLALFQLGELVIIVGAAVGAFVVANNGKAIVATMRALPRLLRTTRGDRALYMDVMALLFTILTRARKDGMMSIERDVEEPMTSALFSAYPRVQSDPALMEFITDYLRLMLSGNMNAHEIESLMDEEIETYEHENEIPAQVLARVADALPAFGIVAAVMGVVHALSSTAATPAELGAMIANAMVGTFLGILIAYGIISPIAARIETQVAESSKMLRFIKTTLLASLQGYAPRIAVEFGRKVVFSSQRPSAGELENLVRQVKSRDAR